MNVDLDQWSLNQHLHVYPRGPSFFTSDRKSDG
jgi:hypothetical protein